MWVEKGFEIGPEVLELIEVAMDVTYANDHFGFGGAGGVWVGHYVYSRIYSFGLSRLRYRISLSMKWQQRRLIACLELGDYTGCQGIHGSGGSVSVHILFNSIGSLIFGSGLVVAKKQEKATEIVTDLFKPDESKPS